MYVQNHMPDTATLLANLATSIREYQNVVDRYLQQDGAYEVFDPLQGTGVKGDLHMEPAFPFTFWERLGIRHIVFNNQPGIPASQSHWHITEDKAPFQWNNLRKDECIDELKTYFSNCSIIQFANYVDVKDAAGFWDGLFADVIKKEMDKQTIEYIFQLGDVTGRTVFEIDEVLDIIGQYAKHGRVSLVMDEQEANTLWDVLCGIDYEPSPKEKYRLQFSTMHIDTLLILYNNGVMLYSKEEQFDLAGRPLNNIHTYPHSREFFLAGYRLGLLLHLDTPHSIALGLTVSGTYGANASKPTSQALLAYIDDWVSTI